MRYRLDLHVHTEASADSRATLPQLAASARKKGIDAFAVCDHNHAAFSLPEFEGLLLIPAVEYSTEIGHLLGLFLRRPCHAIGEESGRVRFRDAACAIHEAGGLCILAHPFEKTNLSVQEIRETIAAHSKELDGIEIDNCRAVKKRKNANLLAAQTAERLGGLRTAGSDAHLPRELGGAYVEVEASELTAEAIRAALSHPLGFHCGKCRHMALAKSQWILRRKSRASFRSYLKWLAFAGVCLLRWLKGVFV